MTFAISPAELSVHASSMRVCAESTTTARAYASDNITLELYEAGIIFQQARAKTHELRDAIRDYLSDLNQADTGSATELDAIAARSIELDDTAEAELDAAYPDSGAATPLPPGSSPGSVCIAPPESALVAPPSSAPTDLPTEILTTNWLSPSTVLDQAVGLICGLFGLESPFTRIGKSFSGDWDHLYACGESVRNIGNYLEMQADARRTAMATSAQTWQGEAATAATTFFARQGELLDEASRILKETQPEFDAVVRGMRSSANAASGLMATIIDASLIAWGCYAVGGATAATGIGAIIGGICGTGAVGVAVYTLYELFTLCQSLLSILDALTSVIGLAMSFVVGTGSLPQVASYDNAQV